MQLNREISLSDQELEFAINSLSSSFLRELEQLLQNSAEPTSSTASTTSKNSPLPMNSLHAQFSQQKLDSRKDAVVFAELTENDEQSAHETGNLLAAEPGSFSLTRPSSLDLIQQLFGSHLLYQRFHLNSTTPRFSENSFETPLLNTGFDPQQMTAFQWQLFSALLHLANNFSSSLSDDGGSEEQQVEDNPIDLSIGATKKTATLIFDKKLKSPACSPCTGTLNTSDPKSLQQHFSVVTKKAYSAVDLEKAVRDIRSGQLGTRRASVVYNIPRSTLRNKIYKLDALESAKPTAQKCHRLNAFARPQFEGFKQHKKKSNGFMSSLRHAAFRPRNSPSIENESFSTAKVSDTSNEFPYLTGELNLEFKPQPQENCDDIASFAARLFVAANVNCEGRFAHQQHFKSLTHQTNGDQIDKSYEESILDVNKLPTPSSSTASNGKRKRPKRGQYRKYDKDVLNNAVASVKSGEMSVHKAGSVYGVPHSTLEYKVKERNLLRCLTKKQSLLSSDSSSSLNNTNPDSFS